MTHWLPVAVALLLAGQAVLVVVLIQKVRRLAWQVHRLVEELRQVPRQAQALDRLLHLLRLERGELPPAGAWAASPDVLLVLAEHCLARRPERVLDCGGGLSTVVLARCCQLNGCGHVVALEEGEEHAAELRRQLGALALDELATVCCGSLVEHRVGERRLRWYPLDAVPASLDLVFVDGPANADGRGARYPAGPLLLPRLAAGGAVVVDDAARPDEAAMITRWTVEHPELGCRLLDLEKGGAVLSR